MNAHFCNNVILLSEAGTQLSDYHHLSLDPGYIVTPPLISVISVNHATLIGDSLFHWI